MIHYHHSVPTTLFPSGIPTYRGHHGHFAWPATLGPTVLLHDDFDLLWVTRGKASLDLSGGILLLAGPGDVLLLPAFVAATIRQVTPQLVFWHCHFDFRAGHGPLPTAMTLPLKIPRGISSPVVAAYASLNAIDADSSNACWHRESALINLIAQFAHCAHARRLAVFPHAISPPHDPRLTALRIKIDANPAKPWRVRELARAVDISPSHLHALWRRMLGSSLKAYLVRARLKHALAQLNNHSDGERKSIKQIAAACGFSSQHLFSRQFRKAFGVTPTDFRKSAGV